jgi:hypothetical protein
MWKIEKNGEIQRGNVQTPTILHLCVLPGQNVSKPQIRTLNNLAKHFSQKGLLPTLKLQVCHNDFMDMDDLFIQTYSTSSKIQLNHDTAPKRTRNEKESGVIKKQAVFVWGCRVDKRKRGGGRISWENFNPSYSIN